MYYHNFFTIYQRLPNKPKVRCYHDDKCQDVKHQCVSCGHQYFVDRQMLPAENVTYFTEDSYRLDNDEFQNSAKLFSQHSSVSGCVITFVVVTQHDNDPLFVQKMKINNGCLEDYRCRYLDDDDKCFGDRFDDLIEKTIRRGMIEIESYDEKKSFRERFDNLIKKSFRERFDNLIKKTIEWHEGGTIIYLGPQGSDTISFDFKISLNLLHQGCAIIILIFVFAPLIFVLFREILDTYGGVISSEISTLL